MVENPGRMTGRDRRTTATLIAAIALTAALALPAAAAAQCGGVEKAHPKRKVAKRPPLAIGDSVMLLALPNLAKKGYNVNARGCRQFAEGLDLIREKRRRRTLPHLVVMALGADAGIAFRQVRMALEIMGRGRILGLVVPLETGGGESHDATVVRNAGKEFPRRVMVLDWPKFSRGHRGWFQPDHLHLTYSGAAAYARLMGRLIPFARPPRVRGGIRPVD
jgi:hypothetical protein